MDIKRIDGNKKINMYEIAKKENINKTEKNNISVQKSENADKIIISEEAKNLNPINFAKTKIKEELAKDLTDNNIEKINALKEQIKNGTYNINSKNIAMAIIGGVENEV